MLSFVDAIATRDEARGESCSEETPSFGWMLQALNTSTPLTHKYLNPRAYKNILMCSCWSLYSAIFSYFMVMPSLIPRPLPDFIGCEIKSGRGLGMRLDNACKFTSHVTGGSILLHGPFYYVMGGSVDIAQWVWGLIFTQQRSACMKVASICYI